jgi:hypothetical protein
MSERYSVNWYSVRHSTSGHSIRRSFGVGIETYDKVEAELLAEALNDVAAANGAIHIRYVAEPIPEVEK